MFLPNPMRYQRYMQGYGGMQQQTSPLGDAVQNFVSQLIRGDGGGRSALEAEQTRGLKMKNDTLSQFGQTIHSLLAPMPGETPQQHEQRMQEGLAAVAPILGNGSMEGVSRALSTAMTYGTPDQQRQALLLLGHNPGTNFAGTRDEADQIAQRNSNLETGRQVTLENIRQAGQNGRQKTSSGALVAMQDPNNPGQYIYGQKTLGGPAPAPKGVAITPAVAEGLRGQLYNTMGVTFDKSGAVTSGQQPFAPDVENQILGRASQLYATHQNAPLAVNQALNEVAAPTSNTSTHFFGPDTTTTSWAPKLPAKPATPQPLAPVVTGVPVEGAPQQQGAAAAPVIPPAAQRKVGQTYPTPAGPHVWTGTGWLPQKPETPAAEDDDRED